MMHIHDLDGCAPTPLAHYLKALGILRLVAEQADAKVRGWWNGERFRLATALDREALVGFFVDTYRPTPLFNPWGARSGFYSGSSETSARTVLESIENATDPRFKDYRKTISVVRETIDETSGGKKPPTDEGKQALFTALRQRVRGKAALWLSAVSALLGEDIEHAALFGTGGSEGSGSYTSAYMEAIDEALIRHNWDHAVAATIFGEEDHPAGTTQRSMGQYLPEGAATPWDFLLAFEGALLLRSAVVTRSSTKASRWFASPFFVAPTAYGYATGADQDEFVMNKGKRMPGRGEQWLPLWSRPLSVLELEQLFADGRSQTKRRRAVDGFSMARAVAGLGVDRGIREFVRYGYQQRNNLATHFAVPLGRFRIPDRIAPMLACLDDLDAWLPRLRREARGKHATARLARAERQLSDALFAVTQHPDIRDGWQAVLLALAGVEATQVTGSGVRAGPIPPLRPEWVSAADDGSPEFRLALALALQKWRRHPREGSNPILPDTVRRHWLPLKGSRFAVNSEGRLNITPEVVISARDGVSDAIALVSRRLIEAERQGERRLPLVSGKSAWAYSSDLAALVAGHVDLDRTLTLARALMAIKHHTWADQPSAVEKPHADPTYPDDAWLTVRLAVLPWPLKDGPEISCDPAIVRRLAAGDAQNAVSLALRRLRAAGIATTVQSATAPSETARLWAAALAFPITRRMAQQFVHRLDPNPERKSHS